MDAFEVIIILLGTIVMMSSLVVIFIAIAITDNSHPDPKEQPQDNPARE